MEIKLNLTKKETTSLLGLLCLAHNRGMHDVTHTLENYKKFLNKVIKQIENQ